MGTVSTDFTLQAAPIVNVASVRHLSPFRYPGGKTWLVPRVQKYLQSQIKKPIRIVDPFLGGGSVPLAVVTDGLVDEAVLYELDPNVASVWKTILSQDFAKLCNLISDFVVTRDNVIELLQRDSADTLQRAFQTIVRNRTFRGGILAAGASLVKTGENGKGITSRWYPETLVKRIKLLASFRSKITFLEGDGLEALERFANDRQSFIFVDPPYTVGSGKRAGSRLYDHNIVDHERVFALLGEGKAPFLMTYDDDLDVLRLAKQEHFVLEYVSMKNTHHNCMYELLITRGLQTRC